MSFWCVMCCLRPFIIQVLSYFLKCCMLIFLVCACPLYHVWFVWNCVYAIRSLDRNFPINNYLLTYLLTFCPSRVSVCETPVTLQSKLDRTTADRNLQDWTNGQRWTTVHRRGGNYRSENDRLEFDGLENDGLDNGRLGIGNWATHCAATPLVYSRSEGLPGRRCLHLERSAGGCDLRSITASVQTTPEDSSVPPQLSEHMCYLNFVFPLWQWS